VKFHDGSAFNADAVVGISNKVLNEKAPNTTSARAPRSSRGFLRSRATARSTDGTVEITTKDIDSLLPYQMLWFLVSSRRNTKSLARLNKFAASPRAPGPFKLDRLVPRERAELVKNPTTGTRSVCRKPTA